MRPLARSLTLALALLHVAAALPCAPLAAPTDETHGHHAHAEAASPDPGPLELAASCPCGCQEPRPLHSGQRTSPAEPTPLAAHAVAFGSAALRHEEPRLPTWPARSIDPVPI